MRELKHLPHRNWQEVRDLWVDNLPDIDFGHRFPEPTLWDLPGINAIKSTNDATFIIEYIEGSRQSAFREAIILARKFDYCRRVTLQAATNGFSTWGLISSYDACFYGAKAFCYLLGIVSQDRGSKLYLDVFHETTSGKGKNRRIVRETINVVRLADRLTHEILWSITDRLVRTLSLPDDRQDLVRRLRRLDFSQVSSIRNKIVYDGGFWIGKDDYPHCDLANVFTDLKWVSMIKSPIGVEDELNRYFELVHLFGEVLSYFLGNIAQLAPALQPEADKIRSV